MWNKRSMNTKTKLAKLFEITEKINTVSNYNKDLRNSALSVAVSKIKEVPKARIKTITVFTR
jgi:hypothetical protein